MAEFYEWFMSLSDDQRELAENLAHKAMGFAVFSKHDVPVSVLLSAVAEAVSREIADQQEWERMAGRSDYPSE